MPFGIDTFRSHLGARTRLLALGRVSALLPSSDNDLIRLNLELGVPDFAAGPPVPDHRLGGTAGVLARGRRRVGDGSQRITVGLLRDAT
jgi:hypothetical protein